MERIVNQDVFEIAANSQRLSTDEHFQVIVKAITDNANFSTCWGGLKGQHHDFDGGLARHTREVIELCFNTRKTLNLENNIDGIELFLSALYHDVGKMRDYVPNPKFGTTEDEPHFIASTHKRLIHHISRSAIIWSNIVINTSLYDKYHDPVLHNILAHHGHREYGSPVAPRTQCAWLVHLCDGISARMNDCDRLDIIVKGKPQ
jgi:3'-5' exoribonuclease